MNRRSLRGLPPRVDYFDDELEDDASGATPAFQQGDFAPGAILGGR